MEGVHWVDPSTLELLGLLVDQGPTARILALFTFRPDISPPWTRRAHVTQVTLTRSPLGVTTPQQSLQATARDPERGPHAREDDPPLIPPLALQRCTCIDEAGVNRAMTRRFGRAPRGERVLGAVPPKYGANRTMWADPDGSGRSRLVHLLRLDRPLT
jgi:hypothetical protein